MISPQNSGVIVIPILPLFGGISMKVERFLEMASNDLFLDYCDASPVMLVHKSWAAEPVRPAAALCSFHDHQHQSVKSLIGQYSPGE